MDELLAPIFAEMERRKLSETAVSQAAVGNPSALKNLRVRRGAGSRNHPIENLQAIARSLGMEVYIGPKGQHAGFAEPPPASRFNDGPGGTLIPVGQGRERMAFPQVWFNHIGTHANDAVMTSIVDDWMAPTVPADSVVMSDRSKTDPEPADKSFRRRIAPMYVCDHAGQRLLCRVERQDSAHYLLSFDNLKYPPSTLRVLDVMIIGEVVWWGSTAKG